MHCDPCEVSPPLDAGQPFGLDLFSQVKKKVYIYVMVSQLLLKSLCLDSPQLKNNSGFLFGLSREINQGHPPGPSGALSTIASCLHTPQRTLGVSWLHTQAVTNAA